MLNQGVAWLAEGYRPSDHLTVEHASIPESEDNILITADDVDRLYPEYETQTPDPPPRRAQSARARYCYRTEESPRSQPSESKRPSSARPPTAGIGVPKRRMNSAGSCRSVPATPRQGVPMPTYQYFIARDPRSKLRIDFHPDPTHVFMDRHARCFDTSHIHNPLLSYRPQPACRAAWAPTGSRPGSSCSARAGYTGNMSKIQRYADRHRPQTAPGTRKELQVLTKTNFLVRGLRPHFCNFVHGMNLHERDTNDQSRRYGDGTGDDGDNELTGESTESISLGQWRRGSSGSGIEGRPASPSSIGDGDDERSSKVTNNSWPRNIYGSKTKGGKADEEKSKEDKENEIQTYIKIPPPEPPKDPKPAWKEQIKVKKGKSSSSTKKGGKSGGRGASKDQGGVGVGVGVGGGDENDSKADRKGRSCVKKKQKKMNDRRRDQNQDTEPQVEPVTTIVEEKKTPEPDKSESDNYHAEVKVPELPSSNQSDKEREEKAGRIRRNLIEAEFLRSDLNEVLNQEMRDHREFDFDVDSMSDETLSKQSDSLSDYSDDIFFESYESNNVRMTSWLTGRLALSQQSSRFTLPMDMKILEKMSPQDYLRKYCIISSRRHILYQKIFSKNRDKTGIILYKDIEKALKDVLVNTITHEEVSDMCELLEITEDTRMEYQLFCGIAAFAERILYPKFVTEDTAELADFQREKIECADFCALDWKFHGVNVNPPVKKMLKSLA